MDDGGGGHPQIVLHRAPTTRPSLRSKLTWVLHPVQRRVKPLSAHHAALTWEWVQPILWVDLIAQITHLARRKGSSGGPRPSALGSTLPLPKQRPLHTPPAPRHTLPLGIGHTLLPGIGSRDSLKQSPFYR